MTRDELEREFKDNGFKINGDSFILDRVVRDNNFIVNGIPQQRRIRFEMKYVCGGSICSPDDSDMDSVVIHEFDIIGDKGEPAETICIENYNDLFTFVQF